MSRAKDTTGSRGNRDSSGVNGIPNATIAQGAPLPPNATPEQKAAAERTIRIDGFQQVIEMLRVADPAFRESLLKRLALKDRELAASLRRDLMSENN